jgi:HSP20 family protein
MFREAPWTEVPATWLDVRLPVDISQVDGNLKVEASLPGFAKDEIEVGLRGGVLSIEAKHSEEKETREMDYYRRERHSGAVSRRVSLPTAVADDAKVDAEFKDGVLRLLIPIPPEAKAAKIEIKGA